jgi:hypothetical protein
MLANKPCHTSNETTGVVTKKYTINKVNAVMIAAVARKET